MSCRHLSSLKSSLSESYLRLHHNLVSPSTDAAQRVSASALQCQGCRRFTPRLHICLHCIHFDCHALHLGQHAAEKNHPLSVETTEGQIYCVKCQDFVYDKDFEQLSDKCWNRAYKYLAMGTRYRPWIPSDEEMDLLSQHKQRKSLASLSSTIGLRGLVNLGNTCFMSCIVQSLVHTPLLRNYFLSDQHVCLAGGDGGGKQCIVCEMSRLFQEFYSGSRTPLVPHVLLHMTWTHAHHLAGYEQQDAHEFFIATLDLLHRHLIRRTDVNPSNCDCIVDTIFTGKLQSDVVCQSCKNVSTTIDPFWDISLDLPTVLPANQVGPLSLQNCLERFTRPEHLGSSAKIKCSTCKAYQESTKQLTMKKLPIVASFHLKRFEHSSRFHKKITTRIAFPEFLDMTPFVSHSRNSRHGDGADGDPTSASASASPAPAQPYESPVRNNIYTLFAVINHMGNIEAGHYASFVRHHRDRWFRCNDHQIVPATIEEVLDSEGYLLFYHKQKLEYK